MSAWNDGNGDPGHRPEEIGAEDAYVARVFALMPPGIELDDHEQKMLFFGFFKDSDPADVADAILRRHTAPGKGWQ